MSSAASLHGKAWGIVQPKLVTALQFKACGHDNTVGMTYILD